MDEQNQNTPQAAISDSERIQILEARVVNHRKSINVLMELVDDLKKLIDNNQQRLLAHELIFDKILRPEREPEEPVVN